MVFVESIAVVFGLAASVFAAPAASDTTFKSSVFEKISTIPSAWTASKDLKVDKDASPISLRIHLVQPGMEKFLDMAMKIATPDHELYGNHLSQSVIDAMVVPKNSSRDLVLQWLSSEGLEKSATVSPRGDSIILDTTISEVEKLLNAEYTPFSNSKSGDSILRTMEYSLPDVLKGHVDSVQPTTFFGLQAMRSNVKDWTPNIDVENLGTDAVSAVTGCTGSSITPTCLANLYNLTSYTTKTQTVGRMGIGGFLKQHPVMTDLTKFLTNYAYYANQAMKYTCVLINAGTCPTTDTSSNIIEANLDVQYAQAITQNIPNYYYSTGGSPPIVGSGSNTNEPYLEFLNYLLALDDASLPNTLSISYGDDEATVPLSYATSTCNLFAQLGARGVSILVSSGDSGVGTTCNVNGVTQFTTSFPAGCPWVTTVGGTTGNSPEAAWTYGGSGFSEIFGRPSYQDTQVLNWLTTDTTHTAVTNYFNASGRAYPDISAQATNFIVYILGSASGVSGTSASAPTTAGIIQLLNSDRIASGKKGLGFLNPWLYSSAASASAFNDITSGKVSGCSGVISGGGFSAVAGWDPATGLGTPNFGNLLTVAQATA
ncbi:peptidase S8/S53 domain-containing protein [Calycina marina]|uniref:tripeptidyl-peptidase II n=1 Tax=Calycina marina TaxID=1763456 RepID=A0A9P7Z951_9HELO|nr:peptidase S8/S53 domain-containing protein [Calycina marina]